MTIQPPSGLNHYPRLDIYISLLRIVSYKDIDSTYAAYIKSLQQKLCLTRNLKRKKKDKYEMVHHTKAGVLEHDMKRPILGKIYRLIE